MDEIHGDPPYVYQDGGAQPFTPDVNAARDLLRDAIDNLEPYTKGGFEPAGTPERKAEHYLIVLNILNRQIVNARIALGWNETP